MDQKVEIDLNYEKDLLNKDEIVAEKNKMKKSKVVLDSGREVTMEEKDNLDKEDLRNKAIRELTSESKSISEKLVAKKEDLENKRKEWQEFKYVFERDKKGNSVAINQDEVKKIHAEFDEIEKEIKELNEMKAQCDKYLVELKSPRKKDEDIVQAWKEVWEQANKTVEEKAVEEPVEESKVIQTTKIEKEEGIEQKIENAQQEMDKANKDYKNIHLGATPIVGEVKLKNEKQLNAFEKNNIINRVKSEMEKDKEYRKEIKLEEKKDEVTSIIINEKAGDIYVSTKEGRRTKLSLEEVLSEKKDMYKRLDIKEICSEIADGKIKGLLLQAKVNPAIIKALDNKEAVKEYISCLNEKRELPFELTHDLRDSKLGFFDKMKMWVHARAEDKIPGTKISFATRFWNKNKALPEPENAVATKDNNIKEQYKVENKGNKIEKQAAKIMDSAEQEISNNVKEIMSDNEK